MPRNDRMRRPYTFLFMIAALPLAACQPAVPADAGVLSAARFPESITLEGRATGPDGPVADALVYLAAEDDRFQMFAGKLVATLTDGQGRFKFNGGIPAREPVVLAATLSADRRVVAFGGIPAPGANRLDATPATTYTTEWLRARAVALKRKMASFDLKRLPDLVGRTQAALDNSRLPDPDLRIGRTEALNRTYALAVGANVEALGDAWAAMTGARTLIALTVVGGGPAGPGPEGVGGPAARLYQPMGLALSGKGDVYLADAGNHRIRKLDAASGRVTTIAGTGAEGLAGDGGPAVQARFKHPEGVLLDRGEKFLYVFDTGNRRIRRITLETGRIDRFAGDDPPPGPVSRDTEADGDGGQAGRAILRGPRTGVFDSQGNLYFPDVAEAPPTHLIRRIDPAGVITTYAGIRGENPGFQGENELADRSRLNHPTQLWVTPDDQLYVADSGNHCIRKIDTDTRLIVTLAGRGGQGTESPEAEGQAATTTRLGEPAGVAVDAQQRIWFADRALGRLYVVKPDGKLATVAGGGADDQDGDARRARLLRPGAIWAEADGNTLVIEEDGVRLRRIVTKFGL